MTDVEVRRVSGRTGRNGDVVGQTKELLQELNLLPTAEDLKASGGLREALKGPPTSVALLEAGATAASKWWAAGLAASIPAAWAAVSRWWTGSDGDVRTTAIWAVAIFAAAAVLGIAYLLGSDVRGRAAVQTETVRARASVAEAFVRAAEQVHEVAAPELAPAPGVVAAPGPADDSAAQVVGLPPFAVRYLTRHEQDRAEWQAVALLTDGAGVLRYLLVKGDTHAWAPANEVAFPLPTPHQRPPSPEERVTNPNGSQPVK